jgi:Flp pilus assembly protein TadG
MEALMIQRLRSIGFLRDGKGSSFVETAILVPVMLLMCAGTMDFARVVYAGIEIANAARAGVQYGALTPGNSGDTAGMAQAALNDAADLGSSNVTASARNFCGCDSGTAEVACSSTTCGTTPSGYVSVTANYTFNTFLRWPGLPQSVVLTRTARMRAQ